MKFRVFFFFLILFFILPQNLLAVEIANNVTDRLYTGQIKDDTGLYYYNARYYDPQLGIFTSADRAQGQNRYAYVGGNPIMRNDPSGNLMATDDSGGMPLLPPSLWNKFWQNTYEKNRDIIDPLVDVGKAWNSGFQDLPWYEKPAVALGVPIMAGAAILGARWMFNSDAAGKVDLKTGDPYLGKIGGSSFASAYRIGPYVVKVQRNDPVIGTVSLNKEISIMKQYGDGEFLPRYRGQLPGGRGYIMDYSGQDLFRAMSDAKLVDKPLVISEQVLSSALGKFRLMQADGFVHGDLGNPGNNIVVQVQGQTVTKISLIDPLSGSYFGSNSAFEADLICFEKAFYDLFGIMPENMNRWYR